MSQTPYYWCLRSTLGFRVTFMSSTTTLGRKYRNSSTVYCLLYTHQIRWDIMILNMVDFIGMPRQEKDLISLFSDIKHCDTEICYICYTKFGVA